MKKMTLIEWFEVMIDANLNKHINLQTAKFMKEIMNGSEDTYIVFDNDGGMIFSILKIKDKDLNVWLSGKVLKDYLIFGYHTKGKSELTRYQQENLHWSIKDHLNKQHEEHIADLAINRQKDENNRGPE